MSEPTTTTSTSTAVVELPNIADPAVLTEILLYTGHDALRLVLTGGSPEAYSDLVFGVVSIFMGSESIALPAGWDMKRVAAHLRVALKDVMAEMPPEDQETFKEDESMPALAVLTCFNEAVDWAEAWAETHNVTEVDALLKGILQDPLYEAHYHTWALTILGDYAQGAPQNAQG